MMKKIGLIILLLVVGMMFISGCENKSKSNSDKKSPFIGGTTGIAVSFAEGNPPSEVYDGGNYPFDIVVQLENKGEYTVPKEKVKVRIMGLYPSEFGVSDNQLVKSPEEDVTQTKKDAEGDVIKGPPLYVTFSTLNHLKALEGNRLFPIRAEVCYYYETKAIAPLCIRKDNLDITDKGVCEVNGNKEVYNSGGPVQVLDFKEQPLSKKKVRFQFRISHGGTGEIYKKDTDCSDEVNTNENKVWVEVKSEQGLNIQCSGFSDGTATSGYARLYEGDIIIMCTVESNTQIDSEVPVNIKIAYDYKEEKSADLLVKHAVE